MGSKYIVKNLEEAVNLAEQFKMSGKYDLFRGQARDWPIVPTIAREGNDVNQTKDILERLYYFMQSHEPLQKYADNHDWFIAVAQHYGMPTNFIDFSFNVKVAAFFATNSKSNTEGNDCVIICLNKDYFHDFINFTRVIYSKYNVHPPEIININVDNLWRLQSQEGCFLYTQLDFTNLYSFDKIIFPYTKPFDKIKLEEIYPSKKSELEILLDQFFNSERRLEGAKRLEKFNLENNFPSYHLQPSDISDYINDSTTHCSWESEEYKEWLYLFNEKWNNIRTTYNFQVHFNYKTSLKEQFNLIKSKLTIFFYKNDIQRGAEILFSVTTFPKSSLKILKRINKSCSRIWDGMRNLPYSLEEIINVLSKYICFEIFENNNENIPSLTNSEMLVLELANEYGSFTRCYASSELIVQAFRDDIRDIFIQQLPQILSSRVLLKVNKPKILFDFHKFLILFKEELIVYQVLYNSENDHNPVIFYTPTQISIFGYA